jgi:hypothetical protein
LQGLSIAGHYELAEASVFLGLEFRVGGDDPRPQFADLLQQAGIAHEVGNTQRRKTSLLRREEIAWPPDPQIDLSQFEPVISLAKGFEAIVLFRIVASGKATDEARVDATADSAAELMEL